VFLALALGILSASCSPFPWVDANTTTKSSVIEARGEAVKVYLYGDLGPTRVNWLVEALNAVLAIYTDPQFDELVRSVGRTSNADESIGFNPGQCPRIPNEDGTGLLDAVVKAAQAAKPHVSAWPNANAIATTRIGSVNAISIDPDRVQLWSGDVASKACLIDTIAHELAHLVVDGPDNHQRYQDGLHIGRQYMVSYRLGRLAACYYQKGASPSCIDESLQAPTCPALHVGGHLELF